MFEIGFSELVVIMVVALVVIGPERLPKVARTMGLLWGRAQRYVNGVKADLERDMAIAELRELQAKVQAEAEAATKSVQQLDQQLQLQGREINAAVEELGQEPQAITPMLAASASRPTAPAATPKS